MPTSDFLGIDFNYGNAIKNPAELGMGKGGKKFLDGTSLGQNFIGLGNYTEVLFTEKTNALKSSGPLGNRYFIETDKLCSNLPQTDSSKNRYVLIDNRPPSYLAGGRGMIPSLLHNVARLNPLTIAESLIPEQLTGDNNCVEVNVIQKLQRADGSIYDDYETIYMTRKNIEDVNPCYFNRNKIDGNETNKHVNPMSKDKGRNCGETFSSMNQPIEEEVEENNYSKMPDDKLIQLYLSTITIIGLYAVLKLINKR
tara:strand:+ start:11994 stop:12755 length:762 start_codon:yes stop_codon:yes gene_type:complete